MCYLIVLLCIPVKTGRIALLLFVIPSMCVSYMYGKYLGITDFVFGGYELITTLVITTIIFILFRVNESCNNNQFVNWLAG